MVFNIGQKLWNSSIVAVPLTFFHFVVIIVSFSRHRLPMNLLTFLENFWIEEKCFEYILKIKHNWKIRCKRCTASMYALRNRPWNYICCLPACSSTRSLTSDTIFHNIKTPLTKRFLAMYLVANGKKWISAARLSKQIWLHYTTARKMLHAIRRSMQRGDDLLTWVVEVDETYITHRKKTPWRMGRAIAGQSCIVWSVDRISGQVAARKIERPTALNLLNFISSTVARWSRIITDELPSYNDVKWLGYTHDRIKHRGWWYVDGDIYTNTIEWFWAIVKRGIRWIHHGVSPKYLDNYLNEYVRRYNHRKEENLMEIMLRGYKIYNSLACLWVICCSTLVIMYSVLSCPFTSLWTSLTITINLSVLLNDTSPASSFFMKSSSSRVI